MKEVSIIIISGLSGSGKSTAVRALEDLGFFCIDNLPVLLLPKFVELCNSSSDDISRVALVMDVREGGFLKEFKPIFEQLRREGHRIELIFLECSDELLIQRFSETRRHHPLGKGGSVREGIRLERHMLEEIKSQADKTVDTTDMNVHQLRNLFREYFERFTKSDMALTFMSFGYKYGIPHDSDIVFDVRFLPNPYFVSQLSHLDGNDKRICEYVFSWKEARKFIEKLQGMLSFQIPLFEREGKTYLTVAVGCTGGRHRSVVIANHLKDFYGKQRNRVYSIHRDLERE